MGRLSLEGKPMGVAWMVTKSADAAAVSFRGIEEESKVVLTHCCSVFSNAFTPSTAVVCSLQYCDETSTSLYGLISDYFWSSSLYSCSFLEAAPAGWTRIVGMMLVLSSLLPAYDTCKSFPV